MGIIYCIYKNGVGYVGQALRAGETGVGRIIEHINYAYGLFDMPEVFSERVFNVRTDSAGLSKLIAQYSASQCNIRYSFDESSCYGIKKQYYDSFKEHWTPSYEGRGLVDFAEFCYVWNWRNSYAQCNTQVGGQRVFKFNKESFDKKVGQVSSEQTQLKERILAASAEMLKKPFEWSGNRNFKEDRNSLDSVYRFFWPEEEIFELALNKFVYDFTTSNANIRQEIIKCLIEAKSAVSKKKYTIENILEVKNILKTITGDLLQNSFLKLPEKILKLITDELKATQKEWKKFFEPFGLTLAIEQQNLNSIQNNIHKELTGYANGNLDSMISRVANIPWSSVGLFSIKKLKHKTYPDWLPRDLKISNLENTDVDDIYNYYLDAFKKWFGEGLLSSGIKAKFTKTSFLTDNWSEFYNGFYNKIHGGPPIALKQTENLQYFTRPSWNNGREAVNYELWSNITNATGKIW